MNNSEILDNTTTGAYDPVDPLTRTTDPAAQELKELRIQVRTLELALGRLVYVMEEVLGEKYEGIPLREWIRQRP